MRKPISYTFTLIGNPPDHEFGLYKFCKNECRYLKIEESFSKVSFPQKLSHKKAYKKYKFNASTLLYGEIPRRGRCKFFTGLQRMMPSIFKGDILIESDKKILKSFCIAVITEEGYSLKLIVWPGYIPPKPQQFLVDQNKKLGELLF